MLNLPGGRKKNQVACAADLPNNPSAENWFDTAIRAVEREMEISLRKEQLVFLGRENIQQLQGRYNFLVYLSSEEMQAHLISRMPSLQTFAEGENLPGERSQEALSKQLLDVGESEKCEANEESRALPSAEERKVRFTREGLAAPEPCLGSRSEDNLTLGSLHSAQHSTSMAVNHVQCNSPSPFVGSTLMIRMQRRRYQP